MNFWFLFAEFDSLTMVLAIRGDTGYLPSETRREYVHVGSRLWLLLRSTESIPGLDPRRPVA